MAGLEEVTDATFESEVLEAELPVLVDFWAEWCGPCRMLAPVLEKIATEHEGKLRILRLDVQANPKITDQFGVTSIPTLILFVQGEPEERLVGYMSENKIKQRLDPYV
ncbi:MAG: thioredoxin [Chloroflexi bacterium]|jgi:thioredoxin 1|nr:thioredoxin [Chloroflexota bacterium]